MRNRQLSRLVKKVEAILVTELLTGDIDIKKTAEQIVAVVILIKKKENEKDYSVPVPD